MKLSVLTKITLIIPMILTASAFANGRDCDWAVTVNEKDPISIAETSRQIVFVQSLINKEKETLQKELFPQKDNWDHILSLYDAHSRTAANAQMAVNDAINYLRETIITNQAVKLTFDRMSKKKTFNGDRPLSEQIREALPQLKVHESTRRTIEQWANSVALVEATQPNWAETEKQIINLLPAGKTSLSELLIEHLRELNSQLASELEQLKNGRAHDMGKKEDIDSAIISVQFKIAGYLDQISAYNKQIAALQARIRENSPVSKFCVQVPSTRFF